MTTVYRCDQCNGIIPDHQQHYDLDLTPADFPDDPPTPDTEDDLVPLILTTIKITGQAEWHFCGAGCLAEWAFGRHMENES